MDNSVNNADGAVATGPVSESTIAAVVSSIVGFFIFIALIVVIGYFSSLRRPGTTTQMTQTDPGRLRENVKTKGLNRAVLEAMPVSMFAGTKIGEEGKKGNTELGASLTQIKSMGLTEEDVNIKLQGTEPNACSYVEQYHEVSFQMKDPLIAVPEPAHGSHLAEPLPQKFPQVRRATTAGVTCLICVDDFVDGDQIRTLPCGHDFHPACIDPWLLDRSTACPSWYVSSQCLCFTDADVLERDDC